MLNDNEIWKEIPNFEGYYEASNKGKIRSMQRSVPNSEKGSRLSKAKEIAQNSTTRSNYLYVQLWKHNKVHRMSVHRMVALTFIPNPLSKSEVNHIDGNKINNLVDNLEWVTSSENKRHAFKIGLRKNDAHVAKQIGTKYNAVSKYHNVTYDKSRNQWKASIKVEGKMLFQKRFKYEDDAAKYVNKMIDELKLNRPKNIIII